MKMIRNPLGGARGGVRRLPHAVIATLLLATAIIGASTGPARADAASIGGLEPITYEEGGDPVVVAPGVTITGGGSFADGYIEFAISGASAHDRLFLPQGSSPDTTKGAITVIGDAVHLGLGDGEHKQIGTVDGTRDGQEGRPLRVNFSAALPNADFSEGVDSNGHPIGWTINEQHLMMGADWVPKSQGRAMSASTGSGPFTIVGPDYTFSSDVNYQPGASDRPGWGFEGKQRNLAAQGARRFDSEVVGETLRLFSSDVWCEELAVDSYCSVFGPDAWSSTFEAKAGDDLAFDWRAANGNDDYEVYGYLVNVDTDEHTELMYGRGLSQPWRTSAGTIPADGTYQFRFLSGTYDATGGRQVGASLYIDNVRVLSSDANAAVAQAVARLVHYEHTGENPPGNITIEITASNDGGTAGPVQVPAEVTLVDDPPTIDPVGDLTFTNTRDADVFSTATGAVSASDPEGDPIAFSVDGATAVATEVGGRNYTHSRSTPFGVLHVNASDGSWAFVPDGAAIDAQTSAAEVELTFTATANGLTATTTMTLAVAIQASAPGAPTDLSVQLGDRTAELTWTPPAWTGGSAVVDHVVEMSTDGGATWTTVTSSTGSATPSYTVTGLVPGQPTQFRVSAVNATGTGDASDPTAITPVTVPSAPTITSIVAGNRVLTVYLSPPSDDGGAEVTAYEYSVDGGVTWRTATTAGSPLVIRPLENGTTYPVRVRAVNLAGPGGSSNEVAAAPVAAPVLPSTPGIPPAPTGSAVLIVDGVERTPTVTRPSPLTGDVGTPAGTLRVSDGSFSVDLLGLDADGQPLQQDAQGRLIVVAGAYASVSGEGFQPGSTVDVWLLSTPILLGEVIVGADGTFAARLPIPDGVEPGPHTVQLNGLAADGTVRTLSVGVVVRAATADVPEQPGQPGGTGGRGTASPVAAPRPRSLAFTGGHAALVSSLAAGLLLVGTALSAGGRRRRGASHAGVRGGGS